ncbi:MAG: HAD family hydrolase [Pirellulales bacterium]
MIRPLLILDLDETLVFASEESQASGYDAMVGPYYVRKRPYVDSFLTSISEWYDLAVWTSSGAGYATGIVELLFPRPEELCFLWSRERCIQRFDQETREITWLKDLKKVVRQGYQLERTLILDDSPEKLARNYGNLVRVSPFEGDRQDDELTRVLPFLRTLASAADVRRVEKRGWRLR